MTSHAPAKCCTEGVKHTGTAVGEIKKFGEYEAYVTYPKDKSVDNAIVILTDIIGHNFINVQLVADQFAANGYFVVVPDLFHGDAIPLNVFESGTTDLGAWLPKHGPDSVDPVVAATIKELREKVGSKRVGGVGYCFGAKYVARFLKQGQFDVGFNAHPSFVSPEELRAIEGPLSIAAAETDQIFPAEKRHESEVILQEIKAVYQINLFSHVSHGFAVRADLSDRRQRFAKEQAFCQAVAWFNEYLWA